MAFTQKIISITFALGKGSFGESGVNTVTISGLRAKAHIQQAGGASMGRLDLTVYGMSLSHMNKLSALTPQAMLLRKNTIIVNAGDANGMAAVFNGQISEAWVEASGAPEVGFHVVALSGLLQAVQPGPPTSYAGHADVATIMSGLAVNMGLVFENNGVSVQIATPYYPGSLRDQAQACAEDANINWLIDGTTLAIWPRGGSRGGAVPVIGPDSGMVGSPDFNGTGVEVTTVFNPTLRFGQTVQVQSMLQAACGKWFVCALSHMIESETPGGAWFSHFQGAPLYNTNVAPT